MKTLEGARAGSCFTAHFILIRYLGPLQAACVMQSTRWTRLGAPSLLLLLGGSAGERERERESEMECGGEWKKKNYHEIDVVVFVLEILH